MASSAANVMLDPVGLLLLPHYPTSLIPAKLLRRMLRSRIWQQYQSGHLSFQAATSRLAQLPFMSSHSWTPCDIAGVLHNRTLTPTPWMLQLLDTLRHKLHLRLLCLCNASPDELRALQAQFPSLFARFDATFSSGEEGLVRPSVRFFEVALSKAHVHPQDSFYLDSWDSFESITAARSLGMHALLLPKAKMDKWSGALPPADHGLIQDILVRFSSPPTGPVQFLMLHCPLLRDLESSSTISGDNICSSVASKVEQNDPQISDAAMAKCLQVTLRRDKSFAADRRRSRAQALGWKYLLETGAQDPEKRFQHPTLTSDGIRIHDNFTQFLIADMLNDDRFLPMHLPPLHGLICFMDRSSYLRKNDAGDGSINMQYYQSDASALEDIPEDLDATSIGLSVLHKFGKADRETINKALDMMLKHRSEDDGIVQVYFDKERPRIDPVVVGNVVFLFHLANRGEEVEKSESFVESVLLHSAYQEGTLYYNLPEAFLWCVAKLMHRFKEHFEKRRPRMRALLAARLREVESNTGGALALAMRMHAFSLCAGRPDNGRDDVDEGQHAARADEWVEELVQLQRADGSWECEPFYRYGSNARSSFTNEALSTAFALAALSQYAP